MYDNILAKIVYFTITLITRYFVLVYVLIRSVCGSMYVPPSPTKGAVLGGWGRADGRLGTDGQVSICSPDTSLKSQVHTNTADELREHSIGFAPLPEAITQHVPGYDYDSIIAQAPRTVANLWSGHEAGCWPLGHVAGHACSHSGKRASR